LEIEEAELAVIYAQTFDIMPQVAALWRWLTLSGSSL